MTPILPMDERQDSGDAKSAPDTRERAWLFERRAPGHASERHTRFVRFAKIGLPLVALSLVVVLIGYSAISRPMADLSLSLTDLVNLGGDKVVTNPTLTYTDENDRAFVVKAKSAVQLDGNTNRWRLNQIRARMTEPQGRGYDLLSKDGVLDASTETMDLSGGIELRSDDGYSFKTAQAQVDMKGGRVASTTPVEGAGPGGHIAADGFELTENGQKIRFLGNVRFHADPDKKEG